jgi:hypothetical protein
MRIAFQIAVRFLSSNKGQTILIALGIAWHFGPDIHRSLITACKKPGRYHHWQRGPDLDCVRFG